MAPEQILHYRIEKKLGEGGMGTVFLATDTKLDRQVALKFLPEMVSEDPEARARLIREAKAASKLNHPNILTIHSVEHVDGRDFIVMEFIEGQTLDEYVKDREVSVDDLLQLVIQISEGLQDAHSAGVVHRDLKPSNILIDTKGRPHILDFGVATIAGAARLTQTGTTVGTIAYSSPEETLGERADHRSDLFSLGVVLYELVTGRLPFRGDHEAAIVHSIVNDQPEPLQRFKSNLPGGLQSTVDKLLDKDPETRYQTAGEVAADLKRFRKATGTTGSSYADSTSWGGSSTGSRRRRLLISVSVLATAALAFMVLKPWNVMLVPSQEATAAENRLAIMYFENVVEPDDPRKLGKIITNLLITDLSESQHLKVVSSQRLHDILKLLGRQGVSAIDKSVASQIAIEAQARWMLLGSILQVEPVLAITAQLVEVSTGNVLSSERIMGQPEEQVFSLVDRLTTGIRGDLAVPIGSEDFPDREVIELTTTSAEAYRHYIEGLDYYHSLDFQPALAHFDSAIALDSNYSAPYLRAGISSYWTNQINRGQSYFRRGLRAVESRSSPPHESLMVSAFALLNENDFQGATLIFDELLGDFPDDKEANFWSGMFKIELGDTKGGIALLKRAIEIDPTYPFPLLSLVEAYTDQDDIPSAIRMAERYLNVRPDDYLPRLMLAELYVRVGQVEQARMELEVARTSDPNAFEIAQRLAIYFARVGHSDSALATLRSFFNNLSNPTVMLQANAQKSATLFLFGRFRESFAAYVSLASLERDVGDSLTVANRLTSMANRYFLLGEIDSAQSVFDRAYKIDPKNLGFSFLPIEIAVKRGDLDSARSLRDSLMEIVPRLVDEDAATLFRVRLAASIAYLEEDYDSALKETLRIRELTRDPDDYSFRIGRCYFELGEAEKARAELEHSIVRYDPLSANGHWLYSWYYLGRAHEDLGNRGEAVKAYGKFLHYWGNADRQLPEILAAKERLAKLISTSP